MSRHTISVHYIDVLTMLVVALRLRLVGVGLRELLAQAVLTVTGYLRRRPDPSLESTLRAAFAELDEGLAAILGDRTPRNLPDH
jgi:hypothetical protein